MRDLGIILKKEYDFAAESVGLWNSPHTHTTDTELGESSVAVSGRTASVDERICRVNVND